jgi:hypothetical protein
MKNLIEKHKAIAEKKNETLRELFIYSGMLHAYKYPCRESHLELVIADLDLKILILEQRLRVEQREIERINNTLNFRAKRN